MPSTPSATNRERKAALELRRRGTLKLKLHGAQRLRIANAGAPGISTVAPPLRQAQGRLRRLSGGRPVRRFASELKHAVSSQERRPIRRDVTSESLVQDNRPQHRGRAAHSTSLLREGLSQRRARGALGTAGRVPALHGDRQRDHAARSLSVSLRRSSASGLRRTILHRFPARLA